MLLGLKEKAGHPATAAPSAPATAPQVLYPTQKQRYNTQRNNFEEQETGDRASKTNSSPLSNVQNPEVSASAENHHLNLLGHSWAAAGKEGNATLRTPSSPSEQGAFPR